MADSRPDIVAAAQAAADAACEAGLQELRRLAQATPDYVVGHRYHDPLVRQVFPARAIAMGQVAYYEEALNRAKARKPDGQEEEQEG